MRMMYNYERRCTPLVRRLDKVKVATLIDLYKKDVPTSEIAKMLNISRPVVYKYLQRYESGALEVPSLPQKRGVKVEMAENTFTALKSLAIREGIESIDEVVAGLINFYVNVKGALGNHSNLKWDDAKAPDYWFGTIYTSIISGAIFALANLLDKRVKKTLDVSEKKVFGIVKTREFQEEIVKLYREWYAKSLPIILANMDYRISRENLEMLQGEIKKLEGFSKILRLIVTESFKEKEKEG